MSRRFEEVVSALTYSFIRERCGDAGDGPSFPHNRVVRFVLEQHARMPDHLRFGLKRVTLLLDTWSLLFSGRSLRRMSPERRWRRLQAWKAGGFKPFRDALRFYESLAVFGWTSLRSPHE